MIAFTINHKLLDLACNDAVGILGNYHFCIFHFVIAKQLIVVAHIAIACVLSTHPHL
ncbi:hypothetical protein [Helicobacter pullorum]